jgi:hypothetical protein
MKVVFTKTGKKNNWVRALLGETEVASFPWRDHPGLPHDLIHCVVEPAFNLKKGFWGLLSVGMDYRKLKAQLETAKSTSTTRELAAGDWHELYLSEALVAVFQSDHWQKFLTPQSRRELLQQNCEKWKIEFPTFYNDQIAEEIQQKLIEFLQQWNELQPGQSLELSFT